MGALEGAIKGDTRHLDYSLRGIFKCSGLV